MARQTKKTRLAAIRAKLQNMDVRTKTVDLAVAVLLAANEVARETGIGFSPTDTTRYVQGTDIIIPAWAQGSDNEIGKGGTSAENKAAKNGPRAYSVPRVSGQSEVLEAIELLAERSPRLVAPVVTGNRVSKRTALGTRVIVANGHESTPEEAEIVYRNRTYSVTTHATHPARRKSEPIWSRSELDSKLVLEGLETFFEDHKRTVVAPRERQTSDVYYTHGELGTLEENPRTVRMIARSHRDAFANALERDAELAMLKANRDAIRAENPPVPPVHPAVTMPIGIGGARATLTLRGAIGWNDAPQGYREFASHIQALSRTRPETGNRPHSPVPISLVAEKRIGAAPWYTVNPPVLTMTARA